MDVLAYTSGAPNNGDLSPVALLTQKNGPYPGRHFCSPNREDLIWPHISSLLANHIRPPRKPLYMLCLNKLWGSGQTQHKRNALSQSASPNPVLSISQAIWGRPKFHRAPTALQVAGPSLTTCLSQEAGLLIPLLWWKMTHNTPTALPKIPTPKILSHVPRSWFLHSRFYELQLPI